MFDAALQIPPFPIQKRQIASARPFAPLTTLTPTEILNLRCQTKYPVPNGIFLVSGKPGHVITKTDSGLGGERFGFRPHHGIEKHGVILIGCVIVVGCGVNVTISHWLKVLPSSGFALASGGFFEEAWHGIGPRAGGSVLFKPLRTIQRSRALWRRFSRLFDFGGWFEQRGEVVSA